MAVPLHSESFSTLAQSESVLKSGEMNTNAETVIQLQGFSDLHETLSCTITPGSISLLNFEIYERGRVSRVADTEFILVIAHLNPTTMLNSWCRMS